LESERPCSYIGSDYRDVIGSNRIQPFMGERRFRGQRGFFAPCV
jgi:hypothetical protein